MSFHFRSCDLFLLTIHSILKEKVHFPNYLPTLITAHYSFFKFCCFLSRYIFSKKLIMNNIHYMLYICITPSLWIELYLSTWHGHKVIYQKWPILIFFIQSYLYKIRPRESKINNYYRPYFYKHLNIQYLQLNSNLWTIKTS